MYVADALRDPASLVCWFYSLLELLLTIPHPLPLAAATPPPPFATPSCPPCRGRLQDDDNGEWMQLLRPSELREVLEFDRARKEVERQIIQQNQVTRQHSFHNGSGNLSVVWAENVLNQNQVFFPPFPAALFSPLPMGVDEAS